MHPPRQPDSPPGARRKRAPVSPARRVALDVLEKIRTSSPEKGGRPEAADIPLPVLLDEQIRRVGADARDAALATELVHGVLRSEKRLIALLAPRLRNPAALPPAVLFLLHTAVYELFCLDHIPARATVHQTVELARNRCGSRMAGLVNAVLRSLLRDTPGPDVPGEDPPPDLPSRDTPPAPAEAAPPPPGTAGDFFPRRSGSSDVSGKAIALAGSLPDWLAAMWADQYSPERALAFAERAAERPWPAYRLNPARDTGEARQALLSAGGIPCGEHGMVLPLRPETQTALRSEELSGLEARGDISRQGAGSQILAEYLTRRIRNDVLLAEAPLWDACCGRGGKTCALLERGVRVTLASDPSARRLDALRADIVRLGLPLPEIRLSGLEDLAGEFLRSAPVRRFPLILVDAPCSGTGTLARTPELRLRLTPRRLSEAERLQALLLERAWSVLAPGGLLAYATCALNKGENEDRIAALLAADPHAFLEDQRLFPPSFPGQDSLFLALIRKPA